jgi:PRC-barrel domain
MNLIRLQRHQHPAPPQRELRQESVLDFSNRFLGDVANLYVDDNRELRFVDVLTRGFMGLGRKLCLVPIEAIADQGPGAITLGVDQETVERAPRLANPHVGPDEELQRATREHYGYG